MSTTGVGPHRWLLVLLSACLAMLGWLGTAQPARADSPTRVLLLLDVSGSMNEKISGGGTKFAAAKRALKQVAGALPAGTEVGLRVYGSKIAEPKAQNPKACSDSQLVLPIGPLDKSKMYRAVDSFTAKGETPIAYSLEKSVADLGTTGKRVLVLISDGQETCKADPCPTARKLAKSGVDLQFNAIGLAVNGKARKQLQCIADAGDGNYYDASNTSELTTALQKISQRALRPFQVTGTPVKGTKEAADAPAIVPGQYRDRYDASRTPRYYRITRTPGSTITVSIANVVKPYPALHGEIWRIKLTTPDDDRCSRTNLVTISTSTTAVLSGAARSGADDRGSTSSTPAQAKCDASPVLLMSLTREPTMGNRQVLPVEILVTEEPPVTNQAGLPPALEDYTGTGPAVRATKPVRRVLGGTAFSDSPTLTPGSWTDTLAVAETIFYRVRLQPGQRLRASLRTPTKATPWKVRLSESIRTDVALLSPARVVLTRQHESLMGSGSLRVTAASPQIRVRNREERMSEDQSVDKDWSTASVAGDYFVRIQVDPLQRSLAGRIMQVQLDIAVDGKPAGQPVYAQQDASPSPTATPTDAATPGASASAPPSTTPSTGEVPPTAGSGGGLARVLEGFLGGLLLAAAATGGVLWWRRRVKSDN